MAITQALCTSFKAELLDGVHDMNTDTFKIALYTSSASLGASTTAYTTSNEVASGSGYTAGGNTITGGSISSSGTTAFVDFADTTWAAASFTASGALIYNSSKSDKAVAVLDFGGDKIGGGGDFTIKFPAATATDALIRLT
jgi:hypothetical protein